MVRSMLRCADAMSAYTGANPWSGSISRLSRPDAEPVLRAGGAVVATDDGVVTGESVTDDGVVTGGWVVTGDRVAALPGAPLPLAVLPTPLPLLPTLQPTVKPAQSTRVASRRAAEALATRR
jgi:hypothetical protein